MTPVDDDEQVPKVEFLLCGSPNDAFYSQMAFFRLCLDVLGGTWREARLVAVFGDEDVLPLPPRWTPHFEHIEVVHASSETFRRKGFFAANDLRFELLDPEADLSCLCDADTALLRPLPVELLRDVQENPAILGVIAHRPFPVSIDTRGSRGTAGLYPGMPQELAWDKIGEAILGHPPTRSAGYTLPEGDEDRRCPFYVNYGFLAGPPELLEELHEEVEDLQRPIADLLGNDFSGQVAIALAVEKAGLPWRALPMRYNFPNDRRADRLHPEELDQVLLLHYLRHRIFDRHEIFANERAFTQFLAGDLTGSNHVFQNHVRQVTAGIYPFSETASHD